MAPQWICPSRTFSAAGWSSWGERVTPRKAASDLVLAVDASTTACKALVFDATGRVLAEGRGALELFNPEPDGYEQDAEHWWTATVSAIRQATQQLGDAAKRVRAVC